MCAHGQGGEASEKKKGSDLRELLTDRLERVFGLPTAEGRRRTRDEYTRHHCGAGPSFRWAKQCVEQIVDMLLERFSLSPRTVCPAHERQSGDAT
jgi:hypothetical protein